MGLQPMEVYQQLEERRLGLLQELAEVHEQQQRTLVGCMRGLMESRSPQPRLSPISSFAGHGLGIQCDRVGVGLAQM